MEAIDLQNTKTQLAMALALSIVSMAIFTGFHYHSANQVPEDRKVAVIVLDGADFKVLDKLKQEGELPNIEQLEQEGLSTDLETPEAFSPQEWTRMSTGMSTENTSIERDWSYEDGQGNQLRLDSNAVDNRRFWSYLNEAGIETGVYHWVMTWPVEPVKGFMVSGFLTANLDEMTYPEDIELSNEEARRSLVGFNTFDVAHGLNQEYYGMDVLVYGFQISDRIQHSFWQYIDDDDPENQEYRELVYKPYKEVDKMVGELRPDYTVILVSDHGFEEPWANTYRADINDVLEDIGLARYQETEENMARSLEFNEDYPLEHVYSENEVLNGTHYRVRFEHLNNDDSEEIKRELSKLRFEDGSRFLTDLTYEEEVFEAVMYINPDYLNEPRLDEVPMQLAYARGQLPILEQEINILHEDQEITSSLGPKQTGDHPPGTDGVFYAAGEGIVQEGRTDIDINSKELAPLVLYLKGVPIPEEMDAQVPIEIFESEYQLMNPQSYNQTEVKREDFELDYEREESEEERIDGRLEDLGYLR